MVIAVNIVCSMRLFSEEKMMRTEEIVVLKYDELGDSAKETAKNWFKEVVDYPWFDDGMTSIKVFSKHFGITVVNYEIGAFSYSWVKTNADKSHFRGLKLKDIDRDHNPTGYCVDWDLWNTFYDTWKITGDPLKAFHDAIECAVTDIQKDWEYQYSDEAVEEMLIINEYEFTEDGKRYA